MNIHEYQAKSLFEKYGVPVPKGAAAKTAEEFDTALASLPEGPTMVKSQIHAGGRGKGTFTNGYKGGVKFCKTKADAKAIAGEMLGNTLVTIQTGPAGRKVQTVYFTVASDIKKEYYLAVLLDRASSRPVIVASTEGGVDIETVAHDTPEKITKIVIDPAYGVADFQLRQLIAALELAGAEAKNAAGQALDALAQACKAEGVAFVGDTIERNVVYEGVIETAEAEGCDLIVMAAHGRRGMAALLIGSGALAGLNASRIGHADTSRDASMFAELELNPDGSPILPSNPTRGPISTPLTGFRSAATGRGELTAMVISLEKLSNSLL
jgi:nucleotide-binding universal stress UspA family protein